MLKFKPCGVDALAFALCSAGLLFPSFLLNKENRLVPGDGLSAFQAAGFPALMIIVAVLLAVFLAGRYFHILRITAVSAVLTYTVAACGRFALGISESNMFARVSFSTGFWLFFLGCVLFYLQAYTLQKGFRRPLLTAIVFVPLAAVVALGGIDKISVMQEYANYADRFNKEIVAHLIISVGSILMACVAGIPLGIYSAKRKLVGGKIFDVLNIVQTVPSIALFGLLMAPLAWLASHSEALRQAGVSGIGWAPAVTALFLYSLLPIVRNTCEGVESIEDSVRDAARGVGMTELYMLFRVELPLSMPVILNGVRVALVQSIGNTAVVSLIGAGGLGIFIFQGLGQSAVPLIMLGTIPTIVLAVLADGLMQLIITLTGGGHVDRA